MTAGNENKENDDKGALGKAHVAGALDDADITLDLEAPQDSDDDIMAMLEEESRKTGTNQAITQDDLDTFNAGASEDAPPPVDMEVDDGTGHEDELLKEWNQTLQQRALTKDDLK